MSVRVPACRKGTVGVGVHHKRTPVTCALVPVSKAAGLEPEFYGCIFVARREDFGNREARILELQTGVEGHACGNRCIHTGLGGFHIVIAILGCDGISYLIAFRLCFVGKNVAVNSCDTFAFAINMVGCHLVAAADGCAPREGAFVVGHVLRCIEALAIYDGGNDGLVACTCYGVAVGGEVEGRLKATEFVFVVNDGGFVDVAVALSPAACLDNEEIFERHILVEVCAEVSQVVAKLHRLGVQASVGPFAEHRYLGRGVGVTAIAIASILEVVEGDGSLRLRGVEVTGDTSAEADFRAARIVHLQADGAQRAVVFANAIYLGEPPGVIAEGAIAIEPGSAISVRAIDETIVAPAAPGVGNNPGTYLVGTLLAFDAVTIEVEFNAVVVAHNRQGVVHARTPFANVIFVGNACSIVGCGRGDALPFATAGHTDTYNTTAVEVGVAIVVPEPVLHSLATFLRSHADGEVGRLEHTIVHGFVPFVVACHPSEVVVRLLLIAKQAGIGLTAIGSC